MEKATRICGLLPDFEIKRLAIEQKMIDPFVDHQVRVDERSGEPVISSGLGYAGYDIKLGTSFAEPKEYLQTIDPKTMKDNQWDWFEQTTPFYLEPNHFILGRSIETFQIPDDVMAICTNKSKLARCGLFPNISPLEPGWRGVLTMEIANLSHLPIRIFPSEGIAQLLFFRLEQKPVRSYQGVYQNQPGIVLSRL